MQTGAKLHAIARYRKELPLSHLYLLGRLVGIGLPCRVENNQVADSTFSLTSPTSWTYTSLAQTSTKSTPISQSELENPLTARKFAMCVLKGAVTIFS